MVKKQDVQLLGYQQQDPITALDDLLVQTFRANAGLDDDGQVTHSDPED